MMFFSEGTSQILRLVFGMYSWLFVVVVVVVVVVLLLLLLLLFVVVCCCCCCCYGVFLVKLTCWWCKQWWRFDFLTERWNADSARPMRHFNTFQLRHFDLKSLKGSSLCPPWFRSPTNNYCIPSSHGISWVLGPTAEIGTNTKMIFPGTPSIAEWRGVPQCFQLQENV